MLIIPPLFTTLLACHPGPTDSGDSGPGGDTVTVMRDSHGVPHIFGETVDAVQYAHGYAQAQDHLEPMLVGFLIAEGELATALEEGDELLVETGYDTLSPLEWDLISRQFRFRAAVDDRWAEINTLDPADWEVSTSEVLEAFAAGVTAYMDDHPEAVPGWWSGAVEPQTLAAWERAVLLLYQVELIATKMAGKVPEQSLHGSNGWVIGQSLTGDGSVYVQSDPHQPWGGPTVWYEVHLVGGELDVVGATLFGVPSPPFFHNTDLAVALTSNGADNADAFAIPVDPADPTRYLLDATSMPFTFETVELTDPSGRPQVLELAWSHQGPVVYPANTADFSTLDQVVVGAATMFDQVHSQTQLHAMGLARDLAEFEGAMALLQLQRWNVMVGTSAGDIFYLHNSRHPDRLESKSYNGIPSVTTTEEDWTTRDVWTYSALARLENPAEDYVQNCNNSPEWTLASGQAFDATDWPDGYMKSGVQNPRAAMLLRALSEHTEPWSFEAATALGHSAYSIQAEWFVGLLEEAYGAFGGEGTSDSATLSSAMSRLEGWDLVMSRDSEAATLYVAWQEQASPYVDMKVEPTQPLSENMANQAFELLISAWDELEQTHGTADVPWGDVNRVARGERSWGVAAAGTTVGTLKIMNTEDAGDGTRVGVSGSSYTRLVRLAPGEPPRAVSVKPRGNSEDPSSVHFDDLTALFAASESKEVPFTLEEVEADLSTVPVLELSWQ